MTARAESRPDVCDICGDLHSNDHHVERDRLAWEQERVEAWATAQAESANDLGESDDDATFPFDLAAVLARPQPPVVYLCKRFNIVKGRPTIISGYAGSIKTWLACDMALAVAAGLSTMWAGVEIQLAGKVRHIDYENLPEVSARRYQRLAKGRGIDLAKLGDKLGRVALPRVYLTSAAAEDALARACKGVSLAIIDSLRAASPGVDENSSTIREQLDVLLRVTKRTGTVFVVLHHEGKTPTSGGTPRAKLQNMRGSSALADAIDCALAVEGQDDGVFTIEQAKSSWGVSGEVNSLRLVDEGAVEAASGMSRAIRFESVDVITSGPVDALESCMVRIASLLGASSKPLGSREIRAKVKGRNQTKLDALGVLVDRGTVVQHRETKLYSLAAPMADAQRENVAGSGGSPRVPGTPASERVPGSPPFRGEPASGTRARTGTKTPAATSPADKPAPGGPQ